jgi:hypothetical protein
VPARHPGLGPQCLFRPAEESSENPGRTGGRGRPDRAGEPGQPGAGDGHRRPVQAPHQAGRAVRGQPPGDRRRRHGRGDRPPHPPAGRAAGRRPRLGGGAGVPHPGGGGRGRRAVHPARVGQLPGVGVAQEPEQPGGGAGAAAPRPRPRPGAAPAAGRPRVRPHRLRPHPGRPGERVLRDPRQAGRARPPPAVHRQADRLPGAGGDPAGAPRGWPTGATGRPP